MRSPQAQGGAASRRAGMAELEAPPPWGRDPPEKIGSCARNVARFGIITNEDMTDRDYICRQIESPRDADGRVVAQRGATYPVDYSYDEFGDKVSMTTCRDINAAGDVTRWLRDEATGLLTNKVYADGKGPCYDYTHDGKLATRTWARGIVTTYSYDDNGSLTNTVYSDGTPIAWGTVPIGDK